MKIIWKDKWNPVASVSLQSWHHGVATNYKMSSEGKHAIATIFAVALDGLHLVTENSEMFEKPRNVIDLKNNYLSQEIQSFSEQAENILTQDLNVVMPFCELLSGFCYIE